MEKADYRMEQDDYKMEQVNIRLQGQTKNGQKLCCVQPVVQSIESCSSENGTQTSHQTKDSRRTRIERVCLTATMPRNQTWEIGSVVHFNFELSFSARTCNVVARRYWLSTEGNIFLIQYWFQAWHVIDFLCIFYYLSLIHIWRCRRRG